MELHTLTCNWAWTNVHHYNKHWPNWWFMHHLKGKYGTTTTQQQQQQQTTNRQQRSRRIPSTLFFLKPETAHYHMRKSPLLPQAALFSKLSLVWIISIISESFFGDDYADYAPFFTRYAFLTLTPTPSFASGWPSTAPSWPQFIYSNLAGAFFESNFPIINELVFEQTHIGSSPQVRGEN